MADNLLRGVKRRRNYCKHCESHVSKSTFYRHKSQFYDVSTRTWIKAVDAHVECSSSSLDSEDDERISARVHDNFFVEPELFLDGFSDYSGINVQQQSDSSSTVTHGDHSSSSNQGRCVKYFILY